MLLLSVNGFDRVPLNEALQRFYVESQRSTNLDAGYLPQPGLLVDGVYLQTQVLGGLPDVQEPLTDAFIRHRRGLHCHPSDFESAFQWFLFLGFPDGDPVPSRGGFAWTVSYGASKRMSRFTRTVNLYPAGTLIVGCTFRLRRVI